MAIVVSGGNVAVLANYYILDDPESNKSVIMLFYNANDGSLVSSDKLSIPSAVTIMAADLAANDVGEIMGSFTIFIREESGPDTSIIVMPYYRDNGEFQFDQWWFNGTGEQPYGQDITSDGRLFYIAGAIGRIPNAQHPYPVFRPLVMIYDGAVALVIEEIEDDSPFNVSSGFGSVYPPASGVVGNVWFAGAAYFDMQLPFRKKTLVGGSGFNITTRTGITAHEDESCGASSFETDDATITIVSQEDALAWLKTPVIEGHQVPNQCIYIGSLIYSSAPPPNAVVVADVTQDRAPFTVNLDASGSTISQGYIADYQWTVINVATGAILNPNPGVTTSFTFTEPGTFAVHVDLTSDKGVKSTGWVEITVTT